MIRDQLKNWQQYHFSSPALAKAFAFLEQVNEDTADGTYELDGKNMYAMVQSPKPSTADAEQLEVHRKYIDIQYLISGSEILVHTLDDGTMDIHTPYSNDCEAGFLCLPKDRQVAKLAMKPGDFAVFFPNDAHCGAIQQPDENGQLQPIKKVVIKVAVELW